jgi:hypothetical protein
MASSFERGFPRKLIVASEGSGRHFVLLRLLLEGSWLDTGHTQNGGLVEPRALEEARAVHAHRAP